MYVFNRSEVEQRIARAKAEIISEQKVQPDLQLALITAIKSHIDSLKRELARAEEGMQTACSGECNMDFVLDAENDLYNCTDRIAGLTSDIKDFEEELEEEG
jgi:hypothetical protein